MMYLGVSVTHTPLANIHSTYTLMQPNNNMFYSDNHRIEYDTYIKYSIERNILKRNIVSCYYQNVYALTYGRLINIKLG